MLEMDAVDRVLHAFGHANVAEITGRTRRLVRGEGGRPHAVQRVRASTWRRFKRATGRPSSARGRGGAVAARPGGERGGKRCNIVLELPWAAEDCADARPHPPRPPARPRRFRLLVTDVPAEGRVAYSLSRRLRRWAR